MVRFEELQGLWQSQAAPAAAIDFDAASLAGAFRRYGRRRDAINIAKVAVLAVQLVYLVARLRHRPLEMSGALLADLSVVYYIRYEWRNQRAIARMNFAAPSAAFVRNAIARLTAQRHPFRCREFVVLMAGFWAGCNIMLAARWPVTSMARAALGHALLTALPFLLYPFGNYLRALRWDRECRPLVRRLHALLQAIQEFSL